MQGNLQLADMPVHVDGFAGILGMVAQYTAPYAAAASFAFYGVALLLGVFLALGLKKLADRARYRRFRREVVAGLHATRFHQVVPSTQVLEPAE